MLGKFIAFNRLRVGFNRRGISSHTPGYQFTHTFPGGGVSVHTHFSGGGRISSYPLFRGYQFALTLSAARWDQISRFSEADD